MNSKKNKNKNQSIIYYDGLCNLCGGIVKFIRRIDKANKFQFLPLQLLSNDEKIKLKINGNDYDSVVLISNNKAYSKCSAIFLISEQLNFPWSLIKVIKILPVSFCDKLYDLIAKFRYFIFGKQSCIFDLNSVESEV